MKKSRRSLPKCFEASAAAPSHPTSMVGILRSFAVTVQVFLTATFSCHPRPPFQSLLCFMVSIPCKICEPTLLASLPKQQATLEPREAQE
jgi:hypothetical protein